MGRIAGHERAQALDLGEEKRRPLVGGEPARESDGEHVGIEERPRLRDALGGLAAALASLRDAPAYEGEQPLLQHLMQIPELAVVDAIDGPPHGGLGAVVGPVDAHVAAVELPHLGREPGVHVHAVGDMADGHLVGGALGPQRPPHLPGYVAVDRRHGVGVPARPQGQDGHAEVFALVVGIDATEAHEVVLGQAERFAQRPDVLFDQRCREAIVPGGNRRVGGEARHARDAPAGGVEGQAVGRHGVAHHLQDGEHAVPFVQVQHARLDAHCAERAHAADAQHQLLTDPGAQVATVEPRGQVAIFRTVALAIAVEQQEGDPPDGQPPHAGEDRASACLDRDEHGLAGGVEDGGERKLLDVEVDVFLVLPPVRVQPLQEVALIVE